MQVNTGDFNNLFVPVRHQFSRLFLYKPKYMTKANPSGRMADFAKALIDRTIALSKRVVECAR